MKQTSRAGHHGEPSVVDGNPDKRTDRFADEDEEPVIARRPSRGPAMERRELVWAFSQLLASTRLGRS